MKIQMKIYIKLYKTANSSTRKLSKKQLQIVKIQLKTLQIKLSNSKRFVFQQNVSFNRRSWRSQIRQ